MFEYINMGVVILSAIIFILFALSHALELSEQKKSDDASNKKSNRLTTLTIVAALMAPFIDSAITKHSITKNIQLFKTNKELKCSNTLNNYLVSTQSGWSLREDSFLKDSLLIRGDRCSLLQ